MTVVLVLVAVAVAVVVLGAALVFLRRRLVRDPFRPGRQQRTALAVLGGTLALIIASLVAARALPPDPWSRFALPGYLGLALLFYLLLALLALELPRLLLNRFAPPSRHRRADRRPAPVRPTDEVGPPADVDPAGPGATGTEPPDADRRRAIARILAGTAGLAATATVGVGHAQAGARVRTRSVEVPLARPDPAVDGLRIAVLTDLHLTRGLREQGWMAETVETVNAARADLIVVVGDLVDGTVEDLREATRPLAALTAPLGTYFVTGNHEFISGADPWVAFLPTLGLRVLRNERVAIERNGATFDLAGVDDVAGDRDGGGPDLDAALAGRDRGRSVILLAHQPVLAEQARDLGVDLQISGHTHGGQMWPLHYLVRLQQGHLAGLERLGDTVLYTSRGVGSWGPPVRVGAPPEISVLTVRA